MRDRGSDRDSTGSTRYEGQSDADLRLNRASKTTESESESRVRSAESESAEHRRSRRDRRATRRSALAEDQARKGLCVCEWCCRRSRSVGSDPTQPEPYAAAAATLVPEPSPFGASDFVELRG